jgi:HAD superfamily hydrolase (TIGR01509 family)
MPLTSVLLDIDGTLLSSNDAQARAWQQAFKEHGYDVPFEKIKPLVGMGGDKLLDRLVPGLTDSEGPGKEIAERRKQLIIQDYPPTLQPTPGARALVERIRAEGMQPVIATSAKSDELKVLLRAAGIEDLVGERANSDDAEQSKPNPDIVQAALQKSDSRPEDSLMIGDTPYDVESAHRAGVRVIAVRSGGHDADLSDALAVYDNPADILAHWEETPLAQASAVST